MGLLDSILGNMMGAGGHTMQGRGGTTSPIIKALMMLLAAKATSTTAPVHRVVGSAARRAALVKCWAVRTAEYRVALSSVINSPIW